MSGSSEQDEFTWLNKQGVESRHGFRLQFTGRFSAEYREGAHLISLYVEAAYVADKSGIAIDPAELARWDGGAAISPAKQREIQDNLRRALEFQGLLLVCDPAPTEAERFAADRETFLRILRAGKQLSINGVEVPSENELDAIMRQERGPQ